MIGAALRMASLPLRVAGDAFELARELAAVPAKLREIAEAVAALPELERQFARIARDTAVLARDAAAIGRVEDAVAELSAALPALMEAIARVERTSASASVPAQAADEELATAAARVGGIAERFPRVRRRRFATGS